MIIEQTNSNEHMTELPPLSIVTITKVQLMEFLPRLTQQVTGQDLLNRPEWWPVDIPWDKPTGAGEQLLREVMLSCYKSPSQEKMLGGASIRSDPASKDRDSSTCSESACPKQEDVLARIENVPEEDSPVWVCFVCAKEFADQDRLMEHQELCEQEEEKKNMAIPHSPRPNYPKAAPSIPPPPPKPSDSFSLRPVTLHKVIRRQPKRKMLPDLYIPPPPEEYFQCLGLRPTPSLEEIKDAQKKENDRDLEVIKVDVFDTPGSPPLSQIISTTTSPRTPRSLMSQLSRDEGSARKRCLSFSQSSTYLKEEQEDEEESQSDSDNSDERSEGSVEDTITRRHYVKNSLLGIDICSPLGQRLKSNWDLENPFMMDNATIDQYCKDPDSEEKNIVMDKLRVRPTDYQVTFKFTKKYFQRYCHQYKFTHAERIEFLNVLKTGLSKDSRKSLSGMKPCQVKLKRLSAKEIKVWTTPKPKPVYRSVLASHLAQNVQLTPGSYVQNVFLGSRSIAGLAPAGYRYSGPNPGFIGGQEGLIMNKVGYGPTPQLLVRTVSHSEGGQQGMRLEVLPILKNDQIHHLVSQNRVVPSSSYSGPKKDLSGSQKRKQSFAGIRDDDEISIISLSSDEEDEPKKNIHSGCQKTSGQKVEMQGKKKIGPASFKRRISGQTQGTNSPSIIRRNPNSPNPPVGSQRSMGSASFRIVNGHLLNPSSQTLSSLHGIGVVTQTTTASDTNNDNLCLKISNVRSLQGFTSMPSPQKERTSTSKTMQVTHLQHASGPNQSNPRPAIDDVIVIDDD